MNADLHRYRFASQKQWQRCLFSRVEVDPSPAGGWRPLAPYSIPGAVRASPNACAPADARFGTLLWRDEVGHLYRLERDDVVASERSAPEAIAGATRIVVTAEGIWVIGTVRGTLELFDDASLSRLLTVTVSDDEVADIANDGHQGVFALTGRDCHWSCVRVDCAGHVVQRIALGALLRPLALAFLRDAQRFFVIDQGHAGAWLRVYAATGGGEILNVATPSLGICFRFTAVGSDERERIFLAGLDQEAKRTRAHMVVMDADAEVIADLPLSALANGVAGTRDGVVATTRHGLEIFAKATVVPDATAEARCTFVTPMLQAPDRPDARRWLRTEAVATLPPGTTMQIAYAATADPADQSRLLALSSDASKTSAQRVQELLELPNVWNRSLEVQGSAQEAANADVALAAPLYGVDEPFLWIAVTLIAPAGSALPVLRSLDVLYPGKTLMESLPAIYQAAESQPDSFVRALVGVLETTSQDLDAKIAATRAHIEADSAPLDWLNFVARWLGLPWDDSLSEARKRAIIEHASAIAKDRGTRAGLDVLLSAILPGPPARYRITDATADFGFATTVGTQGCGSALPALLGGLSDCAAELGSKALLGTLRLPCGALAEDGTHRLVGRIRVDIAASATERHEWSQWMRPMLESMIPATAQLALRWTAPRTGVDYALDGGLRLEDFPAAPHVGGDAVTRQIRLPDRRAALSASGADMGTRLY